MRVVLAAGCFDLFHVAHLRYLENAAKMGDCLVVSVTRDAFVGKGPGRPVIPQEERLEIVQAVVRGLGVPGVAALYDDGLDALKECKPSIFCKGDDWRVRGIPKEITDYCEKNGIEIRFTKPNPHVTTGKIAEKIKCVS
jgi:cytidyltransferase-like protein